MGVITLILVFVVVLLLGMFQQSISVLVKWVTKHVFQDSTDISRLKEILKQVVEDQNKIDMKEEFPKYARLGRKKTNIQEQLKSLRQSKTTGTLTFSWGLTILLNILHTMCLILLIWQYRYVELIKMNPEWFWPIANLVAFPTGIPGAIGITCWVLVCNVILRRLTQLKLTWESSKLPRT